MEQFWCPVSNEPLPHFQFPRFTIQDQNLISHTASPGFWEPSLVLYAYTPGSQLDRTLIRYMIDPVGIDPAILSNLHLPLTSTNENTTASS